VRPSSAWWNDVLDLQWWCLTHTRSYRGRRHMVDDRGAVLGEDRQDTFAVRRSDAGQ
jgi:hypothetical protein